MNTSDILARFEDDLRRSSPHTRKARLTYARMFLDFAGVPPWTRTTIQKFMDWVDKPDSRGQRYAPGTQKQIFSIAKRVVEAARTVADEERISLIAAVNPDDPSAVRQILQMLVTPLPTWPMGKRDAPRVRTEDICAPALEFGEVEAMVGVAREAMAAGQLIDAGALLALATTYGVRREELLRCRPEHLDWSAKTIYIDTCKGGDTRVHRIPQEIEPVLKQFGFTKRWSLYKIHEVYLYFEDKAKVKHRDGAGVHSIRRSLITILRDRLPLPVVKSFLRWKMKASPEMADRYYSKEPREIDDAVFAVHPFLAFWG